MINIAEKDLGAAGYERSMIYDEINYLLHARLKGQRFTKNDWAMEKCLEALMTDYDAYSLNERVLVVLIETDLVK